MTARSFWAVAADVTCALVGVGLVRNAPGLPAWADLTCTCVGLVFIWLCLVTWPWERPSE